MTARVISTATPLILGSASPRRRDILTGLGIPIRVQPADVSEVRRQAEAADDYLMRIVRDKLCAVVERLAQLEHGEPWQAAISAPREATLPAADAAHAPGEATKIGFAATLVADTIVVIDGDVLGKPRDIEDAERLLERIAGRTHVVKTRYALARPEEPLTRALERTIETRVSLRAASAGELRRYARTGEGLDKAGAYAAQGIGAFLVEHIEGSYTNVVGLPACEVVVDLRALGLLREFP